VYKGFSVLIMAEFRYFLVLCASFSLVSSEGFLQLLRTPRLEDTITDQNALDSRQGMVAAAVTSAPEEIVALPTEDPTLHVVPLAGGTVLKGGAGIVGLTLTQGVEEATTVAVAAAAVSVAPEVVFGSASASSAGINNAADMSHKVALESMIEDTKTKQAAGGATGTTSAYNNATTMPPMGTTMPPMGTTMPPMGTTMPPMGTTMPPMGTTMPPMGTTTYAATGTTMRPGTTTAAYGSSYASSSYGSGSSGYGSSSSSGGSSSGSTSSGTINSIGVPYGYYTQVQYFPYAQNASQQMTHPIIFSPYLPIPSYINKYFGLNLPLTMGKR